MNPSQEQTVADLVAAFRTAAIETLVENARRAHVVGDLLGQRHLHRGGKHTHAVTNALPERWTYAPRKSTDYGYKPAGDRLIPLNRLSFQHVAEEAETYLVSYRQQLEEFGGAVINGTPAPFLEDLCQAVRTDVADTIADGIREGWSPKTVAAHLSEVMDGERWKLERIARTEMMRIQFAGMQTRYAAAGIETATRINGPNPCPECAAASGEKVPIDEMNDHPLGECDFVPDIVIPPPEEALIDEDEIARLLAWEEGA